jgi:hypothetical protein
MATCKSCGAEIVWTRTENGNPMPLDPGEFPVVENPQGAVLAVTDKGKVIHGDRVSDSCESGYVLGRISHFATCPNANQHRRINR